MRVSLLSQASTRKTSRLRPSLATLFPTLFALTSSTVQVQCFASVTSSPTLKKPFSSFATFVRGGSSGQTWSSHPQQPQPLKTTTRGLFSTTEASSSTDTTESSSITMAQKLEALRARMKELDLDVYLIPSDDPHLSGK